MTRWYRAPEIILGAREYTKAIDVWSLGCILGELIGRTTLFPGEDYMDQISRMIAILGSPSIEDREFISVHGGRQFIDSLPLRQPMPWTALFDEQNPMALDLLSRMLTFNPKKRYTIEQCINHPYFADLHDPEQEPISKTPFDWSFDNFTPTKAKLQQMIYDEALEFRVSKAPAENNLEIAASK